MHHEALKLFTASRVPDGERAGHLFATPLLNCKTLTLVQLTRRLNQHTHRGRSTAALGAGRVTARARTEQRWRIYRRVYLPHLERCPDTGYLAAA